MNHLTLYCIVHQLIHQSVIFDIKSTCIFPCTNRSETTWWCKAAHFRVSLHDNGKKNLDFFFRSKKKSKKIEETIKYLFPFSLQQNYAAKFFSELSTCRLRGRNGLIDTFYVKYRTFSVENTLKSVTIVSPRSFCNTEKDFWSNLFFREQAFSWNKEGHHDSCESCFF